MTMLNLTTKIGPVIPEIQSMVERFGESAVAAGLLTPVIRQLPDAAAVRSANRRGSRSAPGNAAGRLRRRHDVGVP